MEISLTKDQLRKDKHRFGGNTLKVYARDNFACIDCGMTMRQHLVKYKKRLSINHIDGTGRDKTHKPKQSEMHKAVNNALNNLETLCLPCHGKKDGIRTTSNQYGAFTK